MLDSKITHSPSLLSFPTDFKYIRSMDFNNHHDKDVDFKKGFKKPLPYIIILIVLIVFLVLGYLDS